MRLVSNSDAHSGENLGREANLFEGTPSYDGIFDALRRPPGTRKAQAAFTGGRSSSSLRKENTTLTGTAPAMLSLSRKNP